MPRKKLTLQILLLLDELVHVLLDSEPHLLIVGFQFSVLPKEILIQISPSIVAFLWKKRKNLKFS